MGGVRWVAIEIPPGDFGLSRISLCWAAVGMPPGCYSAIVAGIFLVGHHVGCSSTPLLAECSNSSGSASLLWQIVGSAPVGGFVPLPVRMLLQIRCRGHILGDSCLVVFGHQWAGSSVAAVAVVGKFGVVRGGLAMEPRSHSHYRFHIFAVLVVARHSVLAVLDGSPH